MLLILALDWAALDDITTGNEPNYMSEYTTLLLSFTIFGYLFGKNTHIKAYKLQKRITRNTSLKRIHFHHSLTGMLLALVGLFVNPIWLGIIILGFGIGLFLHDTLSEGLHLITFEK